MIDALETTFTTDEVSNLVDRVLSENGLETYHHESYADTANRLAVESNNPDIVDFLRAADNRWMQIEDGLLEEVSYDRYSQFDDPGLPRSNKF